MERAFLNQHGGDRAASAIELRFDDRTARGARRICLQLHHVGLQQDHLEQLVDSGAGAGRDRDGYDVTAVILRHQADLRKPLLDVVNICVGQIDLVDGDDYRNLRGAGVIDRLLRLRHHAFVGSHHQHDDVGDLRAARAHRSERFVTGSIDERNRPPVGLDGVGADVLRDSAELARRHVGVPNRVEQRGFAVIDVTHHGDDRRPRDHLADDGFLRRLFDRGLGIERNVLDAVAELTREQRGGIDVEHLVERRHLAEFHQFLDQVAGLDAHRAAEIANSHALGDSHHPLGGLGRRDLGLALFFAGESAPFFRHAQPAHLPLRGEIGAALLDDFLFLDSAAGAGLICSELIGRKLRTTVSGLRRLLLLRSEASGEAGTRTRRSRCGSRTGRRRPRRGSLGPEINLAEDLWSLLPIIKRRPCLRPARQIDRAAFRRFRRTNAIGPIAKA